jgi:hypothetical protein
MAQPEVTHKLFVLQKGNWKGNRAETENADEITAESIYATGGFPNLAASWLSH